MFVLALLSIQGQGPQSTATPPYHYHYYQTETFHVLSGILCYKINGKQGRLHPGKSTVIPTYVKHTFWNDPETGEDLDVHITVEGGDNDGFSDDFVHNFYGYLSCEPFFRSPGPSNVSNHTISDLSPHRPAQTLQNKSPNPFQMLRFLYSADVALADLPLCYYTAPVLNFIVGKFSFSNSRQRG